MRHVIDRSAIMVEKYYDMPFFTFLRFELNQHFSNKLRWILTPLVSSFIAYVQFGIVLARAQNVSLSANVWDALLAVFTNQRLILFVSTPLFCYLISDLLPESTFEQTIIPKIGSRRLWWQGKTLALAMMVIFYVGVSLIMVMAIATIVFPWQQEWSLLSLKYFSELGAYSAIFVFSPVAITGIQLALLGFWWFSLGLLVMIFAQKFQRSGIGFLAGIIANFIPQTIDWYGMFPPSIANFLSTEYVFIITRISQDTNTGIATVFYMVFYWVVWIAVFYVLGLKMSLRQDFIQAEGKG